MTQSINPTSINNNIVHNLEDLKEKEIDEIKETETESPVIVLEKSTPEIPFWGKDPNALINKTYILEFFPTQEMTFNQKLNALTRSIIILTIVFYVYTRKNRVFALCAVCLLCIYFTHYSYGKKDVGFQQADDLEKLYTYQGPLVTVEENYDATFQKPEPDNPLSNVLISDYDYNVNKKPAPPAYTENAKQAILDETKKTIQVLNPCQPNIDKKLFRDIQDNLELEQSMRQFYSTANTTIPNDQTSFAEFCYGDMISGKEGNMFALSRDNPRFNLY